MRYSDAGVYVKLPNNEERIVPYCVYRKIEQGINTLRSNIKEYPKPIRWLLKNATKELDTTKHVEMSLIQLISSVEELGGKIEWEAE